MTEEIIAAIEAEMQAADRLKNLLDAALVYENDPFIADDLDKKYRAAWARWNSLREDLATFERVS